VLISDIEKVFLSIEVVKEDRDFLLFLWFNVEYDLTSKVVAYRFCCVLLV